MSCAWAPSPDQRRACGAVGSQDAGHETQGWHPLEYSADCAPDAAIEVDGAPHLASIWFGTAPAAALQAIERSIFRRESTGYCRLYLHLPENAVVLCVDEKSQIGLGNHAQPMLPMGLGYVEGVTDDYRCHGTTTLFAALDTAKGKVITQCRQRHRHQEYLDFLREIEKNVPETGCAYHRRQSRHPQTSASQTLARSSTVKIPCALHSDLCLWLNQVETVQSNYTAGHSPQDVSQRQRPDRENRPIRGNFQRPRAAFRLDGHGGFDFR